MSDAMVWQVPPGASCSTVNCGKFSFVVTNMPDGSLLVSGPDFGAMFMSGSDFAHSMEYFGRIGSLPWDEGGALTNPGRERSSAIEIGASPFGDGRDMGR